MKFIITILRLTAWILRFIVRKQVKHAIKQRYVSVPALNSLPECSEYFSPGAARMSHYIDYIYSPFIALQKEPEIIAIALKKNQKVFSLLN